MADTEETQAGADTSVSLPNPVEVEADPPFDKDRAMATIKQLRAFEKEAQAKIKRLEAFETAEKTRKEAEMSEADRLKAELKDIKAQHTQATAQLQEARVKDAARNAAAALSLTFNPGALEDAVKLGVFADLEFTEDGKPKGMNDALKQLQKERPHYFAAQPSSADIGATAKGKAQNGTDPSSFASRWGIKTG